MSKFVAAGFIRKRGAIWVSFFLLWLALGLFSAGTFLVELPRLRRTGPPPGMSNIALRNFSSQLTVWLVWAALAPVAFLLKPFDDARFHKALSQARRQIEQQDTSELGRKLLSLMGTREVKSDAPPRYLTRLMVKTAGRVIFIRTEEIDWVEAYDNYVRLHIGSKAHLLRQTMNELEAALNPEQFARIHRSTIANLDRVKELHTHINGDHLVILHDGTELKLSRSRREWLEQWLGAGAN